MRSSSKVASPGRPPRKSAGPTSRPRRPQLTPEEIALLTSRFDAAHWDATADADRAAEDAAALAPAPRRDQPKKRAAGA